MKTIDMKNDMKLFLYAALLSVFWYVMYILANQVLAALFSFICALLALVNLFYLVFDTIHFMKKQFQQAGPPIDKG